MMACNAGAGRFCKLVGKSISCTKFTCPEELDSIWRVTADGLTRASLLSGKQPRSPESAVELLHAGAQ